MSILACMVAEKSLTKNFSPKRDQTEGRQGQTEGRMDRCKPVYLPLFESGGITTTTTYNEDTFLGESSMREVLTKNKTLPEPKINHTHQRV